MSMLLLRWFRNFSVLAMLAGMAVAAYSQTVTLEPDVLELEGFGSGLMTARLTSGMAPAGGLVVILTSTDPTVAQVPGNLVIPAGASAVSFSVTTSVASGQASITAVLNTSVASADVLVGPQPVAACTQAAAKAANAASDYQARLAPLLTCVPELSDCASLLAESNTAFRALSKAQRAVKRSCATDGAAPVRLSSQAGRAR
jgi:hypothetical protein